MPRAGSTVLLAVAALWSAGSLGWAQPNPGYRVTRTRVLVDTPDQWTQWEIPGGSYAIGEDGWVEPALLRRPTNAVLDADTYERVLAGSDTVTGGVRWVGSMEETAALAIDGDPTTFWEPSSRDPVSRWLLEVDLGRTVIAEKVRVRFVAEGQGDPFLKFRVMLSDGIVPGGSNQDPVFYRAGQVAYPNKDDREFEFTVRPQRPLPEGVSGEIVQLVRIEALDTDGPRGAEVAQVEYEALPDSLRGAVDYHRQTVAGRQIPVDEQTYVALPPDERGQIRYWRRERPRLAELEVITAGENIVVQTQRRINVETTVFQDIIRHLTTDGLHSSYYELRPYDEIRDKYQVLIDLGAKFWLDRIRLLFVQSPPPAYQLRVSDGSIDPSGTLVWHAFEERLNRELYLQVEEQFPLREVRHLELRRLKYLGSSSEKAIVSEIQAYGSGYVSEVVLTSPLIKLGTSRMFTDLKWQGEEPRGTRLEIRTRSGDDLEIVTEYRDRYGRLISKDDWESAREQNRGPKVEREMPGPGWSNWSEAYRESGEAVKSPGPRRMAQVQVKLLTDEPERRAAIRSLQIGLAPPLVEQAVAEIWPVREVEPGVEQEFSLYLRPQFLAGNPGFDRLAIRSSSSSRIELLSLVRATEVALRYGGGTEMIGSVRVEDRDDQGIDISLPEPVTRGGQVYVARFRTRIFLSGTSFWAELTRETRPGVVQRTTEGDAAPHVESQSLVVVADLADARLLGDLSAHPPVLTPNGDGVNDETELRFAVFRVRGDHLLEATIHNLRGRRVRDLSVRRPEPSGLHVLRWNGRDDAGETVPPGIYLAAVRMEVEAGVRPGRTCLVHVAY